MGIGGSTVTTYRLIELLFVFGLSHTTDTEEKVSLIIWMLLRAVSGISGALGGPAIRITIYFILKISSSFLPTACKIEVYIATMEFGVKKPVCLGNI